MCAHNCLSLGERFFALILCGVSNMGMHMHTHTHNVCRKKYCRWDHLLLKLRLVEAGKRCLPETSSLHVMCL